MPVIVTGNGTRSNNVPVIVTGQATANGTCHACGGIVNPAVTSVDERASGHDADGSANYNNDNGCHGVQPGTRPEVVYTSISETTKDCGTQAGVDTNNLSKDDGATSIAKDGGTISTPKDNDPYYIVMRVTGHQ